MAKIATGQHEPYDVTQDGFPYGAVRDVLIDGVPCTMFRISFVGENGWEIYTNVEHGLRVWDSIAEAGQEFDIRPVGIGVYAVTGRIEKGYRLMGAELESEYNPVEAGLARPKVKSADFIGKEAYLEARDADPVAILCTLEMTDHTSPSGVERFPTGGNEPIVTLDGERIVDAHGRPSRVTTAGAAPSLGTFLLLAYLPVEHAVEGNELGRDLHERAVSGTRCTGRLRLGVIAVVGNDGSWAQIERDQVAVFEDDVACRLKRSDYHLAVQALGGVGFLVENNDQVLDALVEAKSLAAAGRPVLINAHITSTDFRHGSLSL